MKFNLLFEIQYLRPVRLDTVVPVVSITVLLLMALACTPSSAPSVDTTLSTTTLAPTPLPTTSAPASTLSPTLPLALGTPTPTSTPDLNREAILSFTLQALEIEVKRNELVAYFASLRGSGGIHGQALAIERFFSTGVPATLRDAPPTGLEGMATLRNRLLLLDSPQSMQTIKDALLHVYDSEIQQAWNQLVYPEITTENLDYWRQLATDGGPNKRSYEYKVGTVWFGLQEIRQQTYMRWAEILQSRAINHAGPGVTIQNAPEPDYRQSIGSNDEAPLAPPFVTYFRVLGIENDGTALARLHINLSENLRDLFRMQQRIGIFTESGLEPEPNWKAYVQLHGGTISGIPEEAFRILGSLVGMPPEQREQAGMTFEPGSPGNLEELQDLMRTALVESYGGIGANLIAKNLPNILLRWQLENPQTVTGTPMSFVDYLAIKFGFSPTSP